MTSREKQRLRDARYRKTAKGIEMNRRTSQRYRDKMRAQGRCRRCGGFALSGSNCWECLNKMEEARALAL